MFPYPFFLFKDSYIKGNRIWLYRIQFRKFSSYNIMCCQSAFANKLFGTNFPAKSRLQVVLTVPSPAYNKLLTQYTTYLLSQAFAMCWWLRIFVFTTLPFSTVLFELSCSLPWPHSHIYHLQEFCLCGWTWSFFSINIVSCISLYAVHL